MEVPFIRFNLHHLNYQSNQPLAEIAVFLGNLDITSQIQIEGQELVYRSSLLPLPIGDRIFKLFFNNSCINPKSERGCHHKLPNHSYTRKHDR
jgi:hypothetical protein